MTTIIDEKATSQGLLSSNALVRFCKDTYSSFSERREALGLSNPGTTDGVAKEVQRDVFVNNGAFTGLRADLTKAFSVSPLFHVSHAFAMGAQGLAPYTFATIFGTNSIYMQGNIDTEGQLVARANYRWTPSFVTKTNVQIAPGPGQAMCQIDNDYTGNDFTASLKSINPSYLEGGLTGIFVGSYMQALTPGLAVGLEGIWQRSAMSVGPETALSYCAKYRGNNWIATAQVQAQGAFVTSYWRRLTDKVEVGADMNLSFVGLRGGGPMFGGSEREGVATVGAKYEFRASAFRAQVNSAGKLSCLLEKRVVPSATLTFCGEMDYPKNTAKLGIAVSLEAAGEEVMEQQEAVMAANGSGGNISIPF